MLKKSWLENSSGEVSNMRINTTLAMFLGMPTLCFCEIWLVIFYGWNTTTIIGSLGILAGVIAGILKIKQLQKKDENNDESSNAVQ